MVFKRYLTLSVLCLFPLVQADSEHVAIEDFAFLTGLWAGEGLGGGSQEMWMPPANGKMFGIFKQSSGNELQFTEFMEISDSGEGFSLRLKHFSADFTGWEESSDYVSFPLVSLSAGKVIFAGLSYQLLDSNSLKVEVEIGQSDGSTETAEFNLVQQEL
jgi:hypothetical protein